MNVCPTTEALDGFLCGAVDPAAIRDHLAGCGACRATLDRLSDDQYLSGWATPGGRLVEPTTDGPGLARLVALAGETPWEGPETGEEPPRPVEELSTFLRPPRRSGDLGCLGPYAIEAVLGRGGMGIVVLGRDEALGRAVALKVLRPSLAHDKARAGFVREARAAASVAHDHVVRVHAVANPDDGPPYLVMEYIDGPTLARTIFERGRLDPREAAEVAAGVADGLAAAHAAGLVHRDIKPANILRDPATGRHKIVDFGLARAAIPAADETREGPVAGTPAYMSPEQARGVGAHDPRSDVYGLGVTLYEALTGAVPFRGAPQMVLRQLMHDEPRPPRSLNDAVPRDLETICLKAMAKEPERRYATASALADDLRRFLKGVPILARPAGPIERSWRWCRNNRRVAALAATVALLLSSLAVGSTAAALMIDRERTKALDHARRADEQALRADAQRAVAFDALTSLVGVVQDQLGSRPGTLELRRSLLEAAREGLRKVALDGQPGADARAVAALLKLGDLDLTLGRTADAQAEFDRAAATAGQLAAVDPRSVAVRRELAAAFDRLGDLARRAYQVNELAGPYGKAFAIRQALAAERPDDAAIRRDLSVSHNKLGDEREINGDPAAARVHYEEGIKAIGPSPAAGPGLKAYRRDLRFSYGRLGGVALHQFDGPAALDALGRSLAEAEAICAQDPEDAASRRDRALAQDYLGMACVEFGQTERAERALRASVDDRAAASTADPSNAEVARAVALGHQHLGEMYARRRDFDAARREFRDALDRYDGLARRDPGSLMAHNDRIIVLRKYQLSEAEAGRFDESIRLAELEVQLQTSKDVPARADQASWLAEARLYLAYFRAAARSIEDPGFARSQPADLVSSLLQLRAVALARRGEHAEAAAAAKELLGSGQDPDAPLSAARAFALAARSLPPDRAGLRAEYTRAAVEAIRLAMPRRPLLVRKLAYEDDMSVLRDDPSYAALIKGRR